MFCVSQTMKSDDPLSRSWSFCDVTNGGTSVCCLLFIAVLETNELEDNLFALIYSKQQVSMTHLLCDLKKEKRLLFYGWQLRRSYVCGNKKWHGMFRPSDCCRKRKVFQTNPWGGCRVCGSVAVSEDSSIEFQMLMISQWSRNLTSVSASIGSPEWFVLPDTLTPETCEIHMTVRCPFVGRAPSG